MRIFHVILLSVLLLGAAVPANALHQNAWWYGLLRPPTVLDENPDPDIVEVTLTAQVSDVRFRPGDPSTEVWTYNGTLPGPLIRAKVGDRLIVHFYNELPDETTIHWHGLELPAKMDGSNISQFAVQPGGYFRYEFDLPRASLFWYHPHIRTNVQVEKGLFGTLLVSDPRETRDLGLPWREHVLVLDDILLDATGQIDTSVPTDPLERATATLNGREGNVLLVNGRADAAGFIERGVPHRLRVVNVSNARFMRFSIPGHTLWRVGGDGGLLETPIEAPSIERVIGPEEWEISDQDPSKGILLTPGERADVVFTPRDDEVVLEWHDINRGRHRLFYDDDGVINVGHFHNNDGGAPPIPLVRLKTFAPTFGGGDGEYVPPSDLRTIEPIVPTPDLPPVPVMFGHTLPDAEGNIVFFVQMKNGMPLPFDDITSFDAPVVRVGENRVFEIHNMTGSDHNFHLHGFVFQHLETEYVDMDTAENNATVPASLLEEKDTLKIPQRPGRIRGRSRSITRIAVRFDDTGRERQVTAFGKFPTEETSGGWLYHCHLLEHSATGMMGFVQVVE